MRAKSVFITGKSFGKFEGISGLIISVDVLTIIWAIIVKLVWIFINKFKRNYWRFYSLFRRIWQPWVNKIKRFILARWFRRINSNMVDQSPRKFFLLPSKCSEEIAKNRTESSFLFYLIRFSLIYTIWWKTNENKLLCRIIPMRISKKNGFCYNRIFRRLFFYYNKVLKITPINTRFWKKTRKVIKTWKLIVIQFQSILCHRRKSIKAWI